MVRSSSSTFLSRRPGISSVWLIMGLSVLLGLGALAVDLALLHFRFQEIKSGCEAGALAGASLAWDAQLIDEAYGCPNLKVKLISPLILPYAMQEDAVRAEATAFAGENTVEGSALSIDPLADIELGFISNPTPSAGFDIAPAYPPNSVRVRFRRGAANPITLGFSAALGQETAEVESFARASLDQRVYGFRPLPSANPGMEMPVPLVPLMIHEDDWQNLICPWADDLSPSAVVTLKADPTDEAADTNTFPLRLVLPGGGPVVIAGANLPAQITGGMIFNDFFGLEDSNPSTETDGTRVVLNGGGTLDLEKPTVPHAISEMSAICMALQNVASAGSADPFEGKRIWPIGREDSITTWKITGFVAARVHSCTEGAPGNLTIEIVPCLLQSKTAQVRMMDPSSRNPWIGKASVTR